MNHRVRWACFGLLLLVRSNLGLSETSPAPDIELIGAKAYRQNDGGLVYLFEAGAAPRLWSSDASELELSWVGHGEATTTATRTTPSGRLWWLKPPETVVDGTLEVRRSANGAPWVAQLRFVAEATVPPRFLDIPQDVQIEEALSELPDASWTSACLAWARRAPLATRPEAHLACGRGATGRGFLNEALSRHLAALYWATQSRRFSYARDLLEAAERLAALSPDASNRAELLYQRGFLEHQQGYARAARQSLRGAYSEAERIGETALATFYRIYLAGVEAEGGRHEHALAVARDVDADVEALPPVEAARARSNLGWIRVRAYEAGWEASVLRRAKVDLTTARATLERRNLPLDAANTTTSLAYAALVEGRLEEAKTEVERALRWAAGRGSSAVFATLLDARIASMTGDFAHAERQLRRVAERASRPDPELADELRWRAHLGLAELHLAKGAQAPAFAELGVARSLLARLARRSGRGQARVRLLEDRRVVFARIIGALVARGALAPAWRLADEAQALLVRQLEEDRSLRLGRLTSEARADFEAQEAAYLAARTEHLAEGPPPLASLSELESWRSARAQQRLALESQREQLSLRLDELDPGPVQPRFQPQDLAPDEALLEIFRHRETRWAFFVTRDEVTASTDPRALLDRKLGREVQFLNVVEGSDGSERNLVAAHRLPDGRRVIEAVVVAHVPSADFLVRALRGATEPVLIAADPRGDLPHARAEGRALARRLDARLLLGAQVDLHTLLPELEGRSLFHFAGHGVAHPESPWDAHLSLAAGQRLDLELLLAHRPRIEVVVLNGCETGRAQGWQGPPVMGLAEGFLVSGARAVLATVSEVEDGAAARFVRRFYDEGGANAPVEAYRRAALAFERVQDPTWQSFKVWARARPPDGDGFSAGPAE